MISNDNLFFEEYKRLDRLCSDIYSCPNGVSQYIVNMESKAAYGIIRIPSWESDFRMLKHVRWVRNRIAHELENGPTSEISDLSFIQDFYDRILSGQDPLSLLRKAGSVSRKADKIKEEHFPPQKPDKIEFSPQIHEQKDTNSHAALLIFFGVIFFALLAFFILYWRYV